MSMIPLFSEPARARFEAIVQPGLLCVFDFDGTLSPIVPRPEDARLPDEVRQRLVALSQVAPVAILTGRSIADVSARLGFDADHVVGNHGIEGMPGWEARAAAYAEQCARWRAVLERALDAGALPGGIAVEDKRHSLSVHYRHAAEPDTAAEALRALFATLAPAPRLIAGKCVFNLLPEGAADKGSAMAQLIAATGANSAVYVGDDVTDEDAFRLRRDDLMSIRIEASPDSAASHFLDRREDIVRLLDALTGRLRALGATNWLRQAAAGRPPAR